VPAQALDGHARVGRDLELLLHHVHGHVRHRQHEPQEAPELGAETERAGDVVVVQFEGVLEVVDARLKFVDLRLLRLLGPDFQGCLHRAVVKRVETHANSM